MSGGVAYVYDPEGVFEQYCNGDMVDLEKIHTSDEPSDAPGRPSQRSISVDDSGMGDYLSFDSERLKILVRNEKIDDLPGPTQ